MVRVDFTLEQPANWFSQQIYGDDPDLASLQKFYPAYRESVLRTSKKTGLKLESFARGSFNANSHAIRTYFEGTKTSDEMNDRISDFSTRYKTEISDLESNFDQSSRNRTFDDEDKRQAAGKPVLRSRFFLAGKDTISENSAQSMSDVVQADLFSWRSSNEETGTFNSVYLDSKRHEWMMMQDPGEPRPPQRLEQMLFGHEVPEQWHDQQPLDSLVYDSVKEVVVQAGLMGGAPTSVALSDQHVEVDPFGLSDTRSTFLRNVNTMSPALEVVPNGVPFGSLDGRGMRLASGLEDWTHPLAPTTGTAYAIQRPSEGVAEIDEAGFKVYY